MQTNALEAALLINSGNKLLYSRELCITPEGELVIGGYHYQETPELQQAKGITVDTSKKALSIKIGKLVELSGELKATFAEGKIQVTEDGFDFTNSGKIIDGILDKPTINDANIASGTAKLKQATISEILLDEGSYGKTLPTSASVGQLFFLVSD